MGAKPETLGFNKSFCNKGFFETGFSTDRVSGCSVMRQSPSEQGRERKELGILLFFQAVI